MKTKFKIVVTLNPKDCCGNCPLLGIRTGGKPPFCKEGFGDPIRMPWRDEKNLKGMYFKRPQKCIEFMNKSGNIIHSREKP